MASPAPFALVCGVSEPAPDVAPARASLDRLVDGLFEPSGESFDGEDVKEQWPRTSLHGEMEACSLHRLLTSYGERKLTGHALTLRLSRAPRIYEARHAARDRRCDFRLSGGRGLSSSEEPA
jgi:hypothetical protein